MPRPDDLIAPFFGTYFQTEAAKTPVKLALLLRIVDQANNEVLFVNTWGAENDPTFPGSENHVKSIEFFEHNIDGRNAGWTLVIGAVSQATLNACKAIRASLITSATALFGGIAYLNFITSADVLDLTQSYKIATGYTDDVAIAESAEETTVTFRFETESALWDKGVELLYTNESQKNEFSTTDTGFRYVPSIQDWDGFWGVQKKQKQTKRNRPKPGKGR